MPVLRDKKNWGAYYISKEDFESDQYPPYASGAGYVVSSTFLQCAATIMTNISFEPSEDAATGILAQRCGVQCIYSDHVIAFGVAGSTSYGDKNNLYNIRHYVKTEWEMHARHQCQCSRDVADPIACYSYVNPSMTMICGRVQ
ncbi:MAG: hypothetical protein ACREBR_01325 [bacterium]